ncbi:hypothetical protein DAMA08_037410 [Martiniozyma asiatica (nom. inval.)]|nr:hypothetical protein DAMA08_037410 [Martiniozyma asiatica]
MISLLQLSPEVKATLDQFLHEDYSMFQKYYPVPPKIPSSVKLLENYMPKFKTIPQLESLIKGKHFGETLRLVEQNLNNKNYLSIAELEKLLIFLGPYPSYSYRLIQIYSGRYQWDQCDEKLITLVLKLAYTHLDYNLFLKLFQRYQSIESDIPIEMMALGIRVKIRTNNIRGAVQLFTQVITSNKRLDRTFLESFLQDIFASTKNTPLCFEQYQLWIQHNHRTSLGTDCFMNALIFLNGSEHQKNWISEYLDKCGKSKQMIIDFSLACKTRLMSKSTYQQLMSRQNMLQLLLRADKEDSVQLVFRELLDLHLKHRNYMHLYESLRLIHTEADFSKAVLNIIDHFEKHQRPDLIFNFLKRVRETCNLRVSHKHVVPYIRSLINKYPEVGDSLAKQFTLAIKKCKHGGLDFLKDSFQVNVVNPEVKHLRFYPVVDYKMREQLLPVDPTLESVETRLKAGFFPDGDTMWKTVKLSSTEANVGKLFDLYENPNIAAIDDPLFSQANSILNNIDMVSRTELELLWKKIEKNRLNLASDDKSTRKHVQRFVEKQLPLIERRLVELSQGTGIYENPFDDIFVLFNISTRFMLPESLKILEILEKYKAQIIIKEPKKIISTYIKWCISQRKWKDIAVLLDWLLRNNGGGAVTLDLFCVAGLKRAKWKYVEFMWLCLQREHNVFEDIPSMKSVSEGITISKSEIMDPYQKEKAKTLNVLPQFSEFYDSSVELLRKKVEQENEQVILEFERNFDTLAGWIDNDMDELLTTIRASSNM